MMQSYEGRRDWLTFFAKRRTGQRDYNAISELAWKRRFWALFNQQAQGLAIYNAYGWITEANPAAERILGRSLAELRASSVSDRAWQPIHADGTRISEDKHPAMSALRTGLEVREYTMGVFNPVAGEQRWLLVDVIPHFPEGGLHLAEAFVCFTDVTDKRIADQRNEELRNQLFHAQRIETLGILVGGIVHDLNNALFPIVALGHALPSLAPKHSSAQKSLELITKSAGNTRDLLRRLLSFSRQEKPNKVRINLLKLAAEEVHLLRATLPEIVTIHEKYEAVPEILADEAQLSQIVINLVMNAAHAIGEHEGEITVEVRPELVDGTSFVHLAVGDTGCGMDKATLLRAFEPFFSTKAKGKGTGLGLFVVQGISENHGGVITIDSAPGKGTYFDIRFPEYGQATSSARVPCA